MTDTILGSIKQMLGLQQDYTPFDPELVMHINSALMALTQLGVGHKGFMITYGVPLGAEDGIERSVETWKDFLGSIDLPNLQAAKSYVFYKVKLSFDPSGSSVLQDNYKALADEYAFRLMVAADDK
jgi:hypothetical protein